MNTNQSSRKTFALGFAVMGAVAVACLAVPTIRQEAAGPQAGGAILITLKNDFIEEYKNRITIETNFTVDVPGKIHPPREDGDMHVSGRAPEVELPMVAEIMNAKDFKDTAVQAIQDAKAPIKIAGAWRLWCEHAGGGIQKQGKPLAKFDTANPDHVFEIHPIIKVGTISTLDSFKPIEGFKYKEAHTSFLHYENVPCKITPNNDHTTSIRTHTAGSES